MEQQTELCSPFKSKWLINGLLLLDEAEGAQLQQKKLHDKDTFLIQQEVSTRSFWSHLLGPPFFWLLCTKKSCKENARMPPKDDNESTLDFN